MRYEVTASAATPTEDRPIDEGWPLLVPTGCIEYHGPHLALGLDTLVVEELLDAGGAAA